MWLSDATNPTPGDETMPATPERFDECRGYEQRRAWLTRENMRRVEEAARRRAADPVEPIDFDFAVLDDAPKAEPVEWELNPEA